MTTVQLTIPASTGPDGLSFARPLAWSALHHRHYRWLVIAAATIAIGFAYGAGATISVLMVPLETDLGGSRANVSFGYMAYAVGAAFGGMLWGWLSDRLDTRPIVMLGASTLGAGLIGVSMTSSLAWFYVLYVAMGGLGFACLSTPLLNTVAMWFDSRRGLALGIVTAGGALGQGAVPFATSVLIEFQGWRAALLGIGCVYLLVLVPLMMFVTKPVNAQRKSADAVDRFTDSGWGIRPGVAMLWINCSVVFTCLCMGVPLAHLVSLAIESGHDGTDAASVFMTLMLAASFGRIAFGLIADRIGGLHSYMLAASIQAATVYGFVVADSLVQLHLVAAIYGFGFAGMLVCVMMCISEAVPARRRGIAMASMATVAWICMGLGGLVAGSAHDYTGGYGWGFAASAVCGVINVAILAGMAIRIGRFSPKFCGGRLG